jgi:hypothetical protein
MQIVEPVSTKVTPPSPDQGEPAAAAAATGRQWCVPKAAADEMMLQENIDFACGQEGVDCAAIRPGGVCYEPDTVQAHAAYAMNLFFQSNGRHAFNCDFGQTGVVTTADPSKIDRSFQFFPFFRDEVVIGDITLVKVLRI